MNKYIRRFFGVLIIICLSLPSVLPLFHQQFFVMHDDTQPARIYEMAKALKEGQFPVRVVADLGYGYGYALFNFYAPLPYYFGAIFHLIGFDAISSAKIMFLFAMLLSGVSMYLLINEMIGSLAGTAVSMLYMYAPYHAVNLYVRGAVGELYAYGLLPLFLLGIYKIIQTDSEKNIAAVSQAIPQTSQAARYQGGIFISSVTFAAILLSHNILGFLTSLFFLGGILFFLIKTLLNREKPVILKFLLIIFFIGIGLSAFFTLPAVMEKDATKVESLTTGGSDFRLHFVYLDQLWDSSWGYAGSGIGRNDGMSFKLGKIQIILGLLGLLLLILVNKMGKITFSQNALFFYFVIILFISLLLTLEVSKNIWEIIPFLSYIQYPWRFLNFILLSLSLFSSITWLLLTKDKQMLFMLLTIGAILFLNTKYFRPQKYIAVKNLDYTSPENLRYKISKISDEYLPVNFVVPSDQSQVAYSGISKQDNLELNVISEKATVKKYEIIAKEAATITTNIAYYPGWQVTLDGQQLTIREQNGRLVLDIPKNKHLLTIRFGNTQVKNLANSISLFSLFLLGYVSLIKNNYFLWLRKNH